MRLWLLAAALLAVPTVEAGLRITAVDVEPQPITPETQQAQITVTGEADCASVLARRLPGMDGGIPLFVDWTGANMLLSTDQVLVDPAPCESGGSVIPIVTSLAATVASEAPAMVAQPGTLLWSFEASPLDQHDPANATAPFALLARPLVVPELRFEARQATLGDAPALFVVHVLNAGNVAFTVAGAGRFEDQGEAATAQVTVEGPRVGRGGEGEARVTVGVPDGPWSQAHAKGEFVFTSAVEPVSERTVPFDFLLVREGREGNQAALPVWPALAALAAVGALRRR